MLSMTEMGNLRDSTKAIPLLANYETQEKMYATYLHVHFVY